MFYFPFTDEIIKPRQLKQLVGDHKASGRQRWDLYPDFFPGLWILSSVLGSWSFLFKGDLSPAIIAPSQNRLKSASAFPHLSTH